MALAQPATDHGTPAAKIVKSLAVVAIVEDRWAWKRHVPSGSSIEIPTLNGPPWRQRSFESFDDRPDEASTVDGSI